MAIKPINGFYVHDQETDTDGVAKIGGAAIADVGDLEKRLTDTDGGIYPTYVQGGIYGSGSPYSSAKAVRFESIYYKNGSYRIHPNGHKFFVFYYDSNGTFTTTSNWADTKEATISLSDGNGFKVVVENTDGSDLNPNGVNLTVEYLGSLEHFTGYMGAIVDGCIDMEAASSAFRATLYTPVSLTAGEYVFIVPEANEQTFSYGLFKAKTMNGSDNVISLGQHSGTYMTKFSVTEEQASLIKYFTVFTASSDTNAKKTSAYIFKSTSPIPYVWASDFEKNPYSQGALKKAIDAHTIVYLARGTEKFQLDVTGAGTASASATFTFPQGSRFFAMVRKTDGGYSSWDSTALPSATDVTLSNNQHLVYNATTGAISAMSLSAIGASSDLLIDLALNHYGYVEGAIMDFYVGEQVAKLQSEISNPINSYYYANDYLPNKIAEVKDKTNILNGVTFAFVTDMHFSANAKQSKYLIKNVLDNTSVPFALCGGDYPSAYGTEALLAEEYDELLSYANTIGKDNWFAVVGNHDFHKTASSSDSTKYRYTWAKTYNAIIRPSERWIVSNATSGGYYCIDNDAQKTRIVMLNTTEPTTAEASSYMDGLNRVRREQVVWLVDRLKEKTDWNVIVVGHIAGDTLMPSYGTSGSGYIQTVLEAFKNKEAFTVSAVSVTDTFVGTTNELVCYITGHSHRDIAHRSNGVLTISTTCDACYRDDGWHNVSGQPATTAGTVTEGAVDIFCIDYDAGTIKTVRIGRGMNREWSIDGTDNGRNDGTGRTLAEMWNGSDVPSE